MSKNYGLLVLRTESLLASFHLKGRFMQIPSRYPRPVSIRQTFVSRYALVEERYLLINWLKCTQPDRTNWLCNRGTL